MRSVASITILTLLALITVLAANTMFIVRESQQALVYQFGQYVREEREAGLKFKVPFIQNVIYLDKWILDLDISDMEVISRDRQRLVVDAFVRYQITDPRVFYRTFRDVRSASVRLRNIIDAELRSVIGDECFLVIIRGEDVDFEVDLEGLAPTTAEGSEASAIASCSPDALRRRAVANRNNPVTREVLMERVRDSVNAIAAGDRSEDVDGFGLQIVDFRIRRADLPAANSTAVIGFMTSERQQEAELRRAEGREERQRIQSEADREAAVILAEANRDSQSSRGLGDACKTAIDARVYSIDEDFYEFYRTMQAYRTAFADTSTSMVLSPDSEFFKFFGSARPAGATPLTGSTVARANRVSVDFEQINWAETPCAPFTALLSGADEVAVAP